MQARTPQNMRGLLADVKMYRCTGVYVSSNHVYLYYMCTYEYIYIHMYFGVYMSVCVCTHTHSLSLYPSLCCLPIHSPRAAGPLRPVKKKENESRATWIYLLPKCQGPPMLDFVDEQTALYHLGQRCTSISNTEVRYVKFSTGRLD